MTYEMQREQPLQPMPLVKSCLMKTAQKRTSSASCTASGDVEAPIDSTYARFDLPDSAHYASFLAETILPAPPTEHENAEAYKREIANWKEMDAMRIVPISTLPPSANLIVSHVVYRWKPDGSLKARVVPWGHHDANKS